MGSRYFKIKTLKKENHIFFYAGYAIYYVLSSNGTWSEVLRAGVTPVIKPRVEAVLAEEKAGLTCADIRDVEMQIEEDSPDHSHAGDVADL